MPLIIDVNLIVPHVPFSCSSIKPYISLIRLHLKTGKQCRSGFLLIHLYPAKKVMKLVSWMWFSKKKYLTALKVWLSLAQLTSLRGQGHTASWNLTLQQKMAFSPSWLWGEISLISVEIERENWGHLHGYYTLFPLYVLCFSRNVVLVFPAWFQCFVMWSTYSHWECYNYFILCPNITKTTKRRDIWMATNIWKHLAQVILDAANQLFFLISRSHNHKCQQNKKNKKAYVLRSKEPSELHLSLSTFDREMRTEKKCFFL